MKKIITAYIIFILLSPFIASGLAPSMQSIPAYFAFLILLVFCFISILLKPQLINKKELKPIDLLPLIFLLVWFYGVIIGILNGNKLGYIFRNFAGMILYFSYYIFLIKKIKESIFIKSIIFIAIFYMLESFYGIYLNIINGTFLFNSLGTERYYFSTGTLIIFPLLSLLLTKIIFPKYSIHINSKFNLFSLLINSKWFALFSLILFFLAAVVFPFSKGNILAFVFIFSSILLALIISRKVSFLNKFFYSFISLFLIILITIFVIDINYIINPFSASLEGNLTRYNQIKFLIGDINFLGNGLGAEIKGYLRDENLKYGFETTYINLLHKFGVMSFFLFFCYFISIIFPIINIIKNQNIINNSLALGMMGFLFPSIGNPMLFSPVSCLLHCASNYLIRKNK